MHVRGPSNTSNKHACASHFVLQVSAMCPVLCTGDDSDELSEATTANDSCAMTVGVVTAQIMHKMQQRGTIATNEVTGTTVTGTTVTRDELYQRDDERYVCKRLHKHSTPKRRAQPRAVLARTGRVAHRKHGNSSVAIVARWARARKARSRRARSRKAWPHRASAHRARVRARVAVSYWRTHHRG